MTQPSKYEPLESTREERQIWAIGDKQAQGKGPLAVDSSEPVEVPLAPVSDMNSRIQFLYSAYNKCAVVDSTNSIVLWGTDFQGFKLNRPEVFHEFKADQIIKRIAFGMLHGLALDERGKLYAWGDGTYGELGSPEIEMSEKPVPIPSFEKTTVKTMSCGMRHSVVVDEKGKIHTFGDNTDSQCGL